MIRDAVVGAIDGARWAVGSVVSGTAKVVAGTRRMVSLVFARSSTAWNQYRLSTSRFDYRSETDPGSNSAVVAAVGWIARNFPDAPVTVTRENRDGEIETLRRGPDGVGRFLRLMEKPNPWHDGRMIWIATVGDYLGGDAYWFKVRKPSQFAGDRGAVVGYWWLPAGSVRAVADPDDPAVYIAYFEWTTSVGRFAIDPADIVHFQNGISERDPRRGVSVYESLYREVFTDDQGAAMTAALMRNFGVPGVTISPANTTGSRTIKDPETVKRNFVDKFSGDKIGEPMVFRTPMDVKVLSWSPDQMNLRDLRRVPEERMTAVLGVPAGVVGLGAGLDRNTFTNYGEARQAGYTEGIIPLQGRMAATLEAQALPDFVNTTDPAWEYDVAFDWTKARAMQESVDALWKRHTDAATKGLETRAAWKRATGQKVATDGSDDVYIIPSNYLVIPVGEDAPAAAPGSALALPNAPRPAVPAGVGNGVHPVGD